MTNDQKNKLMLQLPYRSRMYYFFLNKYLINKNNIFDLEKSNKFVTNFFFY